MQEKAKPLEYGKCLETGKLQNLLNTKSVNFVVFPVYRHFPYVTDLVISPAFRHFWTFGLMLDQVPSELSTASFLFISPPGYIVLSLRQNSRSKDTPLKWEPRWSIPSIWKRKTQWIVDTWTKTYRSQCSGSGWSSRPSSGQKLGDGGGTVGTGSWR